jgi:ABC-type transport system involved in cytochrome c biogenesis permease subunit
MKTEQASLFGVPNTIFGLMGFSALTTLGIVLLAGASFRRWLWLIINTGVLAGFGFFIYLFYEGVYRIHAICPFCFVVWMVVPPVLWYTTLYNITEGNLKLRFMPAKIKVWLQRHHGDVLLVWYLFILTLLLTHFWYYWKTVL